MSFVARIPGRLLTAVLLSTAVALGPTAFPATGVAAAPSPAILLSDEQGEPGVSISVQGSGFDDCYVIEDEEVEGESDGEDADPDGEESSPGEDESNPDDEFVGPNAYGAAPIPHPGTVEVSMGDGAASTTATVEAGTFQADLTVPHDATPGEYTVRAVCVPYPDIYAEATFTVLPTEDPTLELDPIKGDPEQNVDATGSGFNCSGVDVVWDDDEPLGTAVPETGTFTLEFSVPENSSAGTHTVRADCADEYDASAEADFTVTDTQTNGTGTDDGTDNGTDDGTDNGTDDGTDDGTDNGTDDGTDDGTDNGTDDGTDDGTDNGTDDGTDDGTDNGTDDGTENGTDDGTDAVDTPATPVGWVAGPAAFGGVLLLVAAGFALLRHRGRGPRWVHEHVSTALRPGDTSSDVREPSDAGPPTRTVRLEPHTDPGDQSIDRGINRGIDRGG